MTAEPPRRRPPSVTAVLRRRLDAEVARVVVGQTAVVERMLGAVAAGGHVLLEGVPGVAKTLVAQAFARALDVQFRRVQCTPDMLPSDLTGTLVVRDRELVFRPGPVFTNVLLADELNRTPPKTQAALLEAMQEHQVTVDGKSRRLPDPFLVVATQNPIEYEGTYPLPEAQLDRFHVRLVVGYPSPADEVAMLHLTHAGLDPITLADVRPVVAPEDLAALRAEVDATAAHDRVIEYVAQVVQATRDLPDVEVGASPRAAVHLLVGSKAEARLQGRDYVTPDDVATMAEAVLAHRIVLRPEAELDRVAPADVVAAALAAVPVPR